MCKGLSEVFLVCIYVSRDDWTALFPDINSWSDISKNPKIKSPQTEVLQPDLDNPNLLP